MSQYKPVCISFYHRKEQWDFFILLVLFFLFPFASLTIIFRKIYEGKNYALCYLAVFMGVFSMFYFPYGDQYRYFYLFKDYKLLHFNDVFDFTSPLILKSFNLVNLLLFCFAKAGLTFELVRFFVVFVSYFLFFDVYKKAVKYDMSRKRKIFLFLLVYLSVPFFFLCFGFRFGLASVLYVYGLYVYALKNSKGVFFILLSSFCHIYFLIYVFSFLMLCFFKKEVNLRFSLFVSLILMVCIQYIFSMIIETEGIFSNMVNSYVFGAWGEEYEWNLFTLKKLLLIGGVSTICLYICFFVDLRKGIYENIIYVNLIFVICFLSYYTLIERIICFSVPLLVVYFVSRINYIRNGLCFVLIALIIGFLSPFWVYREMYKKTSMVKVLYMPLPLLLMNEYSVEEVNKYVDLDGKI